MSPFLLINEKLFLIFLFFHMYHLIKSTSFDYPYYLTLSNNNIFLIHYEGIDIYDSSFNKIKQIIQFSGYEEMTEEIFTKIELKYDNDFILSIINDKIYIFNNEGYFLYKSEDKINNKQTIKNYALITIGLYNDIYNYTIGYFDNNFYLNLFLYNYNITENNNILLNSNKDNRYIINDLVTYKYYDYYRGNKGLSCEYMSKYNSYSNKEYYKLVCFFLRASNSISTTYYSIYNNTIILDNSFKSIVPEHPNVDEWDNTFIKSQISYNKSLAFIWFHLRSNNITLFTKFNLSSDKLDDPAYYSNSPSEIYKNKFNKIPKNKDISFARDFIDKEIKISLYNNIISNKKYNISYFDLNISCENVNGPKISYYNNNQDYYIYYCFKNCSDESFKNDSYCLNLEKKQKIKRIIICIVIAIIIIILLAISIFLIIRLFKKTKEQKFENQWKKSQKYDKAMNDILTELIPNNN